MPTLKKSLHTLGAIAAVAGMVAGAPGPAAAARIPAHPGTSLESTSSMDISLDAHIAWLDARLGDGG